MTPPPDPVRDLPTCADLPADYCPAAKTPSPELFQRPQELQDSSPKNSSKPEAEPELFAMPAQPQAQKIETAPPPIAEPQPEPKKETQPPVAVQIEEPLHEPRQEKPERLGPNEVHLVTPVSDAAWSAAPILRAKQKADAAKSALNSTGTKNNGCWQCS